MSDEATTEEAVQDEPVSLTDAIESVRERMEAGEGLLPDADEQDEELQDEELATEDPVAEAADEETEGDGDAEPVESDVFIAKLPGRRPGEDDIEIELEGLSQHESDAFNRLRNGYMRGTKANELMTQAQQQLSQAEAIGEMIRSDPLGFIEEHLDDGIRVELAKRLLVDGKVYEAVSEEFDQYDDSSYREAERNRIEVQRRRKQDELRTAQAFKARQEANVREVISVVEAMAPSDMDDDRRQRFMQWALRDIELYADSHKHHDFLPDPASTVPHILESTQVAARFPEIDLGARPTAEDPSRNRSALARGSATGESPAERKARETGSRLRKRAARKRSATGVTPGGTGPSPASIKLPPEAKKTVQGAIDAARKQLRKL